jgi:hypothetical protein
VEIKLKRPWYLKVIVFIDNMLSFSFFLNLILAMELDILIGAFVGLKYARFDSFVKVFNFLFSLALILFFGFITVVVFMKILLFNRKAQDKVEETHKETKLERWKGIYVGLNKKVPFATYVVAINIVKDFLISAVIILGIENNKVQLIPTIILIFAAAVFVIIKQPFDTCLANWTLIINNLAYTAVLLVFYIIANHSDGMTQKERHTKLGVPCVFIICAILLINLIIGIATIVEMIKDACKKR